MTPQNFMVQCLPTYLIIWKDCKYVTFKKIIKIINSLTAYSISNT